MRPCSDRFETLNAYVDAELGAADELELRRHLDVCEACRAEIDTLVALKADVAGSVETRPVPHTLRERLGTPNRRRGRSWPRRVVRLLAVAAMVVVAVRVARWANGPGTEDRVTAALVADHLHFLEEPGALEVQSDDPASVAAWFVDKVPFPVAVPRLQSAALVGGRLCSLWGHKVALAFYDVHGTRLSVFLADASTFPAVSASRCTDALGDYRVCLLPSAHAGIALVGEKAHAAAVLPDLQHAVTRLD